jgi:SCY1-like protein 1
VRLQADPEASIRTNTVLVFGKLAPHLTEASRQKMLLPAFIRAMRDPFVPCRLAALKSMLKAKEFFDPQGIASKLLPAVTPQLLDSAKDVRREAFTVVDDLLFYLRQESERMVSAAPPAAEPAAPLTSATMHSAPPPTVGPVAPAPSSAGYLSGISSWMSSSAKPSDASAAAAPPQHPPQHPPQYPPRTAPPAYNAAPRGVPTNTMASMTVQDDSSGWGDDDDGFATEISPAAKANILFTPPPASNNDDDYFFGGFDDKPAKPAGMKATTGRLVLPAKTAKHKKAPALAVQKLSVDEDTSDGWDEF